MHWDAEGYRKNQQFVAKYGTALLEDVPECDAILDVGCGTGVLTKQLCRKATFVRGIDQSAAMVRVAKSQFPNLDITVGDILQYHDAHRYDVVFSNAVFHWISRRQQGQLLAKVHQLLKQQGLLVAEFGGAYNIDQIYQAFVSVLKTYAIKSKLHFYFPDPRTYQKLLIQQGFLIKKLNHYYRPTPLENGYHGLPSWLAQFFEADLVQLPEAQQTEIIQKTCDKLMPKLWDGTSWVADYWRLQVVAQKK
ncbi:class I SAM-dependent methyltransferase [Agrilactobacillus yilanensis]|uniref:Class I SAM-dependent methyltransferase n=1 Tax=Agrilactobacillus yilanensis TaxID=2485997 RepID=A0ABW4JBL5_9LACO|nr:class I SAM-dependent methyltransferase [Agrilactobacillus yilanensis]